MLNFINKTLIQQNKKAFEQLTFFLKIDLKKLKIVSASVFGSAAIIDTSEHYNDIDIIAYSDIFCRENAKKMISLIKDIKGFFYDKSPIFIEDAIAPRIEFFIKFQNVKFDINIFPNKLCGIEEIETNVLHDSVDLVIGSMNKYNIVLFGKTNFESLINKEFTPFYSDNIRELRLKMLEGRIYNLIEVIEKQIINNEFGYIFYLFKMRNYFIKWLFIYYKKYPFDYSKHLKFQLTKLLALNKEDIDTILLIADNTLTYNAKRFISLVKKYLITKEVK